MQEDLPDDCRFMELALQEAQTAADAGEVPVGAVIVRGQDVIASAHNMVETLLLGTAHAELQVLEMASRRLGAWRLDDCTLYVTKEPCPMCAGAMVNCRLKRVVFGCPDPRTGAAGGFVNITSMPGAIHCVEVTQGILEDKCREMLQGFFRMRRKQCKT